MPVYLYQHPETEEVIEVFQKISETHEYIDEDNVEWQRVWTVPHASIDSQADPFNENLWMEKTSKQKGGGNMGDLFDQAQEASDKRRQKMGYDPVKKKYFEDWSAKRNGKKHPKSFED